MTCATCRKNQARWTASNDRGEQWPVCTSCKTQGERYSARLRYETLGDEQ